MPRILVADDNTNIQRMVSLAFHERGVEVTSVGNGEAAVRRVPDLNPDLILADIFMPVRNGYEVCEWIKKDQKYAHIPVILLVGAFDPLDEKEARRVGADGILKKPFIPPDPLIAMVTATLEKNPKLAAEMARAREGGSAAISPAIEAPLKPPAAPARPAPKLEARIAAPQIPAPIEVTPVTDDSSDDASLAYGFGAGHRDIGEDGHNETAAARAPKSEFEKQADEEFDGASTTSDWRRTAMSFEVSEEISSRPAFSDEDLEPLPLEAAAENPAEPIVESMPAIAPLPGAVIHSAIDPVLEAEPVTLSEADLKAPESWQLLPDDASASADGDPHSEWATDVPDVPSTPYPLAASETPIAAHEEPPAVIATPEAHDAVSAAVPVATVVDESTTAAIAQASPAHESPAHDGPPQASPAQTITPEPTFAAKASHWMDVMGSTSSEPQSDWLSIIHSQQTCSKQSTASSVGSAQAEVSSASKVDEPAASLAAVPATETIEAAPMIEAQNVSSQPVEAPATLPAVTAEALESAQAVSSEVSVTPSVAQHDDHSVSQAEDDWFFAEDAPEPATQKDVLAGAAASSALEASSESSLNPSGELPGSRENALEATVSEPVAVSPAHEETEFVEKQVAAPVASHDAELVEPPAVHVTQEPLLVDEHSPTGSGSAYGHKGAGKYQENSEEIAPAYTFLPTAQANPAEAIRANEAAIPESSSNAQEAPVSNSAAPAEDDSELPSFGEAPSTERENGTSASQSEDGVPSYTPPSPTREQLAHIPFLNPPPDFEAEPVHAKNSAVADFTVEAVVQRILQKIEPQLHDLLSQNLKPLIEDLVHTELQKHDN